jgi:hypothetical protein
VISKMKTVQLGDSAISRFQDNAAASANQYANCPLLGGTLLEGISLTSGQDNQVSHTLGKAYRLWFPVKQDTNATVWEQASADNTKFINLHCSASCTVSLWVA